MAAATWFGCSNESILRTFLYTKIPSHGESFPSVGIPISFPPPPAIVSVGATALPRSRFRSQVSSRIATDFGVRGMVDDQGPDPGGRSLISIFRVVSEAHASIGVGAHPDVAGGWTLPVEFLAPSNWFEKFEIRVVFLC